MSILTCWEPFRELRHEARQMRHLQRAMNQLFGRWGIDLPEWPALAVSYPPVNLWEDDDFVYAEAELPGLKLPDLEITVTANNQLALKGKSANRQPRRGGMAPPGSAASVACRVRMNRFKTIRKGGVPCQKL